MTGLINNNEDTYLLVYCLILLMINIGYIGQWKIPESISEVPSEDELMMN